MCFLLSSYPYIIIIRGNWGCCKKILQNRRRISEVKPRPSGTREELEHLVNYAIAAKSLSVSDLPLNQARIVYPSPGLRPPPPLQGGGQMQEKELRRNSRLSRILLICFVHPVLLMLRLAELAALSYSGGVIVAQVVKVRLVAVVMRFNFDAVLLHGKFSSLNLYVNIIAGN